jgi:hypothetical protein
MELEREDKGQVSGGEGQVMGEEEKGRPEGGEERG